MKSDNYRLQFISHYNDDYSYIDSVHIALKGGCRWVQLRMKDSDEVMFEKTAIVVQQMCKEYGATFIINDNVAIAKKIEADGVHLGKNDMTITEARKLFGEEFVIGSTVNSFEDILCILRSGITPDYFGCGPFRYTSTKKNLASILGYEGYLDINQKMLEHNIQIPIVAIGGIGKGDVMQLLKFGVSGVALSSSILNARNPINEMQEIVNMIYNKY